jgi:hypothetical protein
VDFATTGATDRFVADSQENGETAAAKLAGTIGKMCEGNTVSSVMPVDCVRA